MAGETRRGDLPYRDANLGLEERLDDLLGRV